MRELKLGLTDPPDRRYLYVMQDDQGSGSCWYEYNVESKIKTHLPERALAGYITGLRLHEFSSRFGKKWKLDILMDCGHPYAIRTGVDTVFARGIVLSLREVDSSEVLQDALTICVKPSIDNPKVVYGSVYITNTSQRVRYEWDKDVPLVPIIRNLQSILGDGGFAADESGHDEESDEVSREHTAPAGNRAPGVANDSTVKELKRVALNELGWATAPGVLDSERLEGHCASLHQGRTINDLTQQEAVKYRSTLLALRS